MVSGDSVHGHLAPKAETSWQKGVEEQGYSVYGGGETAGEQGQREIRKGPPVEIMVVHPLKIAWLNFPSPFQILHTRKMWQLSF